MFNYTFFHGTAIVRIVQDKRTFGIKLCSGNNTYLVNNSACIYIKHSSKRLSPWIFTFLPKHIKDIGKIGKDPLKTYIVLICNDDGICCLDFKEFSQLVFVGSSNQTKWIRVHRSPREKYTVTGSDGELRYKIGNSDFPEKIF